jgi:hypothetical protein
LAADVKLLVGTIVQVPAALRLSGPSVSRFHVVLLETAGEIAKLRAGAPVVVVIEPVAVPPWPSLIV